MKNEIIFRPNFDLSNKLIWSTCKDNFRIKMKKYNIALLPSAKSEDFIKLSKQLAFLEAQYQLGDDSLPHVTLLQFYADESQVDEIWENAMHHLNEHSIDLEFKCFSFITFNNHTFYISLIPNNISILYKMHSQLCLLFTPTINKPYDPHLTLISTIDKLNETNLNL